MNYEDFKKQKRGKVRFELNGYNQFDEQAKVMNEADKRKEALQNEKELNPDTFTKEVSAENLDRINQRAEYCANDYIGHPFDEGEDTNITYARESYEVGFKQGWQEGRKWQEEYWDKAMRDNHVELL